MFDGVPQGLLSALVGRITMALEHGHADVRQWADIYRGYVFDTSAQSSDTAACWDDDLLTFARAQFKGLATACKTLTFVDVKHKAAQSPGVSTPVSPSDAMYTVTSGYGELFELLLALVALCAHDGLDLTIIVHPSLMNAAYSKHGHNLGRTFLALLAEMGLAGRFWHLWLGNASPTERLSPYAQDLGEALGDWGIAQNLIASRKAAEDPEYFAERYALAQRFVESHDGLQQERAEAERSCGMLTAQVAGLPVRIIDLCRLDAHAWDPRLPRVNPWQTEDAPASPLLLQLPLLGPGHDGRSLAAMLAKFCQSMGHLCLSITLADQAAFHRGHTAHAIPSSLLDRSCNGPLQAQSAPFAGPSACADVVPWTLQQKSSAPSKDSLPYTQAMDGLPLGAMATMGGGCHAWAQVLRLWHRGGLPEQTTLQCRVFDATATAAEDAMALAYLERLFAGAVKTARPTASASGPSSRTARRVRV